MLGIFLGDGDKPLAQRFGRKARDRDRTRRIRRLRMRLAMRRLTRGRDDRAADAHIRWGAGGVHVALADREHFPDAGRRAEHRLDDLFQPTIGSWT